jgi:PKD repeat protein
MNEGAYDVRLTVTNQYGSDSVFKTGSAAPATSPPIRSPTPETAQEMTEATTVATAVPATTEPVATKSPLLPMGCVVALIAGLLLAAGKKRT